eukprot:Gb_23622 [translate_table: standard]
MLVADADCLWLYVLSVFSTLSIIRRNPYCPSLTASLSVHLSGCIACFVDGNIFAAFDCLSRRVCQMEYSSPLPTASIDGSVGLYPCSSHLLVEFFVAFIDYLPLRVCRSASVFTHQNTQLTLPLLCQWNSPPLHMSLWADTSTPPHRLPHSRRVCQFVDVPSHQFSASMAELTLPLLHLHVDGIPCCPAS